MQKINRRFLIWGSVLSVFMTGMVSAAYPTEVQNVQGTATGTQIHLTWDAATAPGDAITSYRVYWGTASVQTENDFYTKEMLVSPATTEYTITDLTPGTTYYIAVTAINSLNEESETYSKEISVRVPATAGEGLKIISAQQNAQNGIEVIMSAPVVVSPIRDGFFVVDLTSNAEVRVVGGIIQQERVLLSLTDSLTPGRTYKVTATSLVKDTEGMPIKSGITDNISFVADWDPAAESSAKPPQPTDPTPEDPADFTPPVVITPEPKLPTEPATDPVLPVPELTTPPAMEETSAPIVLDTPELLPAFEPEEDKPSAPTDTTAPLDAMNFQVDTSTLKTDQSVLFTWEKSLDLENDVVDQILYVREDLGDWDNGYSIGANLESITLDVDNGHNYQVKIVTVDKNGNKSGGVTVSFSTQLPQSGPVGMMGAGAALVMLVILGLTMARRRTI